MLCTASRLLGYALTGRWEMLCSIYADSPAFAAPVDLAFFLAEGQSHHCARMRDWEAGHG